MDYDVCLYEVRGVEVELCGFTQYWFSHLNEVLTFSGLFYFERKIELCGSAGKIHIHR